MLSAVSPSVFSCSVAQKKRLRLSFWDSHIFHWDPVKNHWSRTYVLYDTDRRRTKRFGAHFTFRQKCYARPFSSCECVRTWELFVILCNVHGVQLSPSFSSQREAKLQWRGPSALGKVMGWLFFLILCPGEDGYLLQNTDSALDCKIENSRVAHGASCGDGRRRPFVY